MAYLFLVAKSQGLSHLLTETPRANPSHLLLSSSQLRSKPLRRPKANNRRVDPKVLRLSLRTRRRGNSNPTCLRSLRNRTLLNPNIPPSRSLRGHPNRRQSKLCLTSQLTTVPIVVPSQGRFRQGLRVSVPIGARATKTVPTRLKS